jgi:hypothetical protein
MIRIDVEFDGNITHIRILRVPGNRRSYRASTSSLARILTLCENAGCRAAWVAHNHLRAVIR